MQQNQSFGVRHLENQGGAKNPKTVRHLGQKTVAKVAQGGAAKSTT
jgi:hypothetical protein